MPAPLLMPVMVMLCPPRLTRWEWILGSVSVVMMPCAADTQLFSLRFLSAPGRPALMRSTGRGSRITPVEKGKICLLSSCMSAASAAQVSLAACMPGSPVPALALPVLMTSARIGPAPAKCSWHTRTGAAQKRLRVNTPATVEPALRRKTVKSRRFALRMPASVTPISTPGTGNTASSDGICK